MLVNKNQNISRRSWLGDNGLLYLVPPNLTPLSQEPGACFSIE